MTTAGGARRWPLHPPPAAGESLTSWLGRLARLYGAGPRDLLWDALGEDLALLGDPRAADLDFDPPPGILRALAARAGAGLGVVRMTTIAGWVPWLAGTLDPAAGQDAFDDYVRREPVLLAPREAGRSDVQRWLPWMPAQDRNWRTRHRACPACIADPGLGTRVLDALPLMTTCGVHGLPLQPEGTARAVALIDGPLPLWAEEIPPPPAVAAMDRLTWQGIAAGTVTLPGRPVHVGVWFRILRTLLDEVSTTKSRLTRKSAASVAMIWEATGRPPRGGLTVWRPYERLGPGLQRAMTEAAATALQLAASGEITPPGTARPVPGTRAAPPRLRGRPRGMGTPAGRGRAPRPLPGAGRPRPARPGRGPPAPGDVHRRVPHLRQLLPRAPVPRRQARHPGGAPARPLRPRPDGPALLSRQPQAACRRAFSRGNASGR